MFQTMFNKLLGESDTVTLSVMAKLEMIHNEWVYTLYQKVPAWNAYVPAYVLEADVSDQIFDFMNNRVGNDWAKLQVVVSRDTLGQLVCTITEQE